MDAPIYPPSTAFEQPVRLPRLLDTRETSIADLKANPAAWAIVVKEMPSIEARIGNPFLQQHLGNFSFRSLTQFGVTKTDDLDRIDVQLKALGEQK